MKKRTPEPPIEAYHTLFVRRTKTNDVRAEEGNYFMKNVISKTTVSLVGLLLATGPAAAHNLDAVMEGLDSSTLGKVEFATSCTEDAHDNFQVGLLLLHHMMYRQSAQVFSVAAETDPECAMAQWGIAMTKFHPLWPGGPTPEETAAGQSAAAKLSEMEAGSDREAAYIDAVRAFYAGGDVGFRGRLAAWAAKQREIDDAYPDDLDAKALDALAQLTMAPRGPDAVPELRAVGKRMDALRVTAPYHPAGYHYALHAYDHPALAEMALEAARGYEAIAPEVPHALHMPSHIFTRLGLWEESAAWNARSAAAVLDQVGGGVLADHYPHAIDYAVYAHLQVGNVAQAAALLAELEEHPGIENTFGSAYATAAAAARIPLETDNWEKAAKLPTDLNPAITWVRYPQAIAMRWFARGVGAARSGDAAAAQQALDELVVLKGKMEEMQAQYWLALLDSQTKSIEAWIEFLDGNSERALNLMRQAAETEDKIGKAPVTPGHILPARELLGDLLFEIGDIAAARVAYETALEHSPNRRRSLTGLTAASRR
ncbi:hypothetical protein OS189_15210 [Sulfitobacter sp. F26169L]|uniref:hypothetical protein n=1 Tax=Sulfitobacter sp. F26169L TaxID=2996015 RepID=UPI002260CDC6|nr:hypothetical protein [Sulfitobacter sp. F26169L]MCX7567694.1 hypothetical protein [Sulfitobacter sp. F26169L]